MWHTCTAREKSHRILGGLGVELGSKNVIGSGVEPLANCAAQGELEHQGGLRARRSRGGKTLNLDIKNNAI